MEGETWDEYKKEKKQTKKKIILGEQMLKNWEKKT